MEIFDPCLQLTKSLLLSSMDMFFRKSSQQSVAYWLRPADYIHALQELGQFFYCPPKTALLLLAAALSDRKIQFSLLIMKFILLIQAHNMRQ